MKQLIQSLNDGSTKVVEVPAPIVKKGQNLIQTTTTLVSTGTERMLIEFGRGNLVQKARSQPDKVKMVVEKVLADGVLTTVDSVKSKLAQPIPLGYCNVGIIKEIGDCVNNLKIGDRVVSNGPHAEVVLVPNNLCAKIPNNVDDETASFVVVASIGLQGIRLAKPTLGESFVVIGAGLIGLLTIQLLVAQGCRVLAIDLDDNKLEIAKRYGAETCNPRSGENPVESGMAFSRGHGVDGVIISASTKSDEPISQAAQMCRKRGRIILVGVAGLKINRADFYEKEITFQVSCSYGPGRYDDSYEIKGQDYPRPFVRWTEQRNFEAVLDMMATGKLDVKHLISHRYEFNCADEAYDVLSSDETGLGILLKYKAIDQKKFNPTVTLNKNTSFNHSLPIVSFIGAGNYASRMLIPAFKHAGAQFHTIATASSFNGVIHGKKTGFVKASTDINQVLANEEINTVSIVTRHNSHADLSAKALRAGKHVFVEKPLAIDEEGLKLVLSAYNKAHDSGTGPQLMVGFNRRFSPHVKKIKKLLTSVNEPKSFIMTVNSGALPADHWTQDKSIGGGRIIGEACHFIDLMRYLANSEIISVQARCMGKNSSVLLTEDKVSITLGFADGSFGTILYFSNGALSFPKERIEIFAAGGVLQLDNFRSLRGFGWKNFKKMHLWKQDKGQKGCVAAFLDGIQSGKPAIDINEIFEIARISIEVDRLLGLQ
jgi:predicted dehydrogenase/threonine dehydrogenase-like Zn-dependent dehydrogenase